MSTEPRFFLRNESVCFGSQSMSSIERRGFGFDGWEASAAGERRPGEPTIIDGLIDDAAQDLMCLPCRSGRSAPGIEDSYPFADFVRRDPIDRTPTKVVRLLMSRF